MYRAIFIYYFVDYVRWPPTHDTGPVVVAVLGETSVTASLENVARKKRVGGRQLQVRRISTPGDAEGCHAVFVPAASAGQVDSVVASLGQAPVLTIGEAVGSTREGVAICFIEVDGALKFSISRQALSRAGLKASSELLKLAVLVDD